MNPVRIGDLAVGNDRPFTLISGPCQIESASHAFEMAGALHELCARLGIGLIYKSSFDKANRTSLGAARGIGMQAGLQILADVRSRYGIPVLTDVHAAEQCRLAAEAVDVLQIPAFLCRQTDLLIAAGETGAAVNVKKGQFLAPWDMANVAAKIASTGNERILLTERGTSFGYNTLVNDMRGLPIMAQAGYPVVFDATHSVQQPGAARRRLRRAARFRPGAGARRDRGRRGRRVHRDPPGPRPCAERRADDDPVRPHGLGTGTAAGVRSRRQKLTVRFHQARKRKTWR